jgi:8-oxo-dGTP pyrophosphatase MutT (NUDIX family)
MDYVVGFMYSRLQDKIVLVQKQKPAWQKNLLNGIGGKIEDSETPLNAMVREFFEETKVRTGPEAWKLLGVFTNEIRDSATVYFYANEVRYLPEFPEFNDNYEPIFINAFSDMLKGEYSRDVVLNLNWIISYMYYVEPGERFFIANPVAHTEQFDKLVNVFDDIYQI